VLHSEGGPAVSELSEAVNAMRGLIRAVWDHDQRWAVTSPEARRVGQLVARYNREHEEGDDSINALMRRCLAVVEGCNPAERFTTEYTATWGISEGEKPAWRVGFYERHHGRHIAVGPTIEAALESWLAEHEGRLPSRAG
jgi:hypothetical protein